MNSPENRRLRTLVWGAIPVIVLGGALSIDRIPGTDIALTVPYAAEGPGPTVDTLSEVDGTEVVDVKAPKTYETSGQLNMTTVSVRTNMTLTQALGRWIMTDDTLVPIDTVIPQGQTDEEVNESNEQAFTQSESAATVAATADGGHRVGHQSHLAGALHGVRDVALMLGAGTRHAARLDLSAIGNVLAQHLRVFVVDVLRVLFAELAELATRLLRVIGHF